MNGRLRLWSFVGGALLVGCATGPEDRQPTELRQQADRAYETGQLQAAQTAYESLNELHPNDLHTTLRLANIAFRQQRWDEAARRYQEVIEMSPQDRRAHYNLAVLHLSRAEQHFQYFSALSEGEAQVALTTLLGAIGQFADSEPRQGTPLEQLGDQLRDGHRTMDAQMRDPISARDSGAPQ